MKLPRITGDEVVRALKRAGFVTDRQRESHVMLVHSQSRKRVVVPVHAGKIVKPGTLSGILYTRRVTLHLFSSGSQAETRKTSRCVEERFIEEMMHNHPLHV